MMSHPAAEVGEVALEEKAILEAQVLQPEIEIAKETTDRPGAEVKTDQLGYQRRGFARGHHIAHVNQKQSHRDGEDDGPQDDGLAVRDLV
jgi:hypothetical protein